jgi:copper chaperone CopZ
VHGAAAVAEQQQQQHVHSSSFVADACQSGCGCEKLHEQLQHYTQQRQQQQQQQAPHHSAAGSLSSLLMRTSSTGPVTTRIHAAGICCPMESRLIHSILDSVPGVLSVDVGVVTKLVTVHHEPHVISPAAIVAALNSAGLQASLTTRSTGGQGPDDSSSSSMQASKPGLLRCIAQLQQHPALPPLSVLGSGVLLLLSFLLLLLPGAAAPALLQQGLFALLAAAVGVPPVLRKAWAGLKNRNLDMNCLGERLARCSMWATG